MERIPARDDYQKAKFKEPNRRLLKPDDDPKDALCYIEIFGELTRVQHLAEAFDAGMKLDREMYRIRSKELVKICGRDFEGMNDVHRASKATIGILANNEFNLHSHLYIILVGSIEEVSIAKALILCNIVKTYSTQAYPVILMPQNIYEDHIIIPVNKVYKTSDLLRVEIESGAWIEIEGGDVSKKEKLIRVFGPQDDVIKAINLIQALTFEPVEASEAQDKFRIIFECDESSEPADEGGKKNPRDKYWKAKIEEPNLRLPKALLEPDVDDYLALMRIVKDIKRRAKHVAAGTKLYRKIYRIRNKELMKFCGLEFKGMGEVHKASKATIGILADAQSNLYSQSYIDLEGTLEEVNTAQQLILDNILKTYKQAYPVILMPPTIYGDSITLPVNKVIPILGIKGSNLLRMEMESGAWIKIEPSASRGGSDKERLIRVFGPREHVSKAIKLMRAVVAYEEKEQTEKEKEQGVIVKSDSGELIIGNGESDKSKKTEESSC